MTAGRHVLVVDDEGDIREVAQFALEVFGGWRVTTAAGGAEAVEHAREDAPDVILLDFMMPGMDGIATLSALRAHAATRDIPVVLLTAKVLPGDRRRFEALAVGFIAKPFDPLTLSQEIRRRLGWEPQ